MLFTRQPDPPSHNTESSPDGLPAFLVDLLSHLSQALKSHLSDKTWNTVFAQSLARQVIINLYPPGKGITAHVDLPHRYADGILGVTIVGSASMTFRRVRHEKSGDIEAATNERQSLETSGGPRAPNEEGTACVDERLRLARLSHRHVVHLPPKSVYVLTGPARWNWSHGIEARDRDVVEQEDGTRTMFLRDTRMSITFRWIKVDGEVLS